MIKPRRPEALQSLHHSTRHTVFIRHFRCTALTLSLHSPSTAPSMRPDKMLAVIGIHCKKHLYGTGLRALSVPVVYFPSDQLHFRLTLLLIRSLKDHKSHMNIYLTYRISNLKSTAPASPSRRVPSHPRRTKTARRKITAVGLPAHQLFAKAG